MQKKKVLVPVADHEFGYLLADFVTSHKWEPGTTIKVLHVEQLEPDFAVPGPFYVDLTPGELQKIDRVSHKLVTDVTRRLHEELSSIDVVVEGEVRPGMPKEEILETASSWPADLVIMGSHGRSGLSRFMLGSVSHSVMTHLPCSFCIVRKPSGRR
jgi:nucleotide-binding universal stress UspA family protein